MSHDELPHSLPPKRIALLLMILILLAGFLLRTTFISIRPAWADETLALETTQGGTLAFVLDNLPLNWSLLHQLLMAWVQRFVGNSLLITRYPSLLAGLFGVAVMYRLGRAIEGPTTGLLAAAAFAASDIMIDISTEIRPYALMVSLGCLLMLLALRIDRTLEAGRPSSRLLAAYALAALLTCYSHYFATLLPALSGLWLLMRAGLRRHESFWPLLGLHLAIALLYLPGLILASGNLGTNLDQGFGSVAWAAAARSPHIEFLDLVMLITNRSTRSLYLIGLLAASGFALKWWLGRGPASQDLFLALWIALPFAVVYGMAVLLTPLPISRYLVMTLPACFLLATEGLVRLITALQHPRSGSDQARSSPSA